MNEPDITKNASSDNIKTLLTYAYIGAVSVIFMVILPVIVGGLISKVGLSESDAGFVVSSDMAGYLFATLTAVAWINRVNCRRVVLASLSVYIIANLACIYATIFYEYVALRFIAGASAGIIATLIVAIMGKTTNPDRVFGMWIIAQLSIGALSQFISPQINNAFGMPGIFSIFVVLALIAMLLIQQVPKSIINNNEPEQIEKDINIQLVAFFGILSILLIYISITSVWAYISRMGDLAGLDAQTVGTSLSIASIAGVIGAISATVLATKLGRVLPLLFSASCIGIAMLILMQNINHGLFLLASSLFLFGWSFIVPYLMASVSEVDQSGKLLTLANSAIAAGFMFGPSVGALLLSINGYQTVTLSGVLFLIIGTVLMLPLAKKKMLTG
jgi:predicted MFS family arabinose efflux permease